MVAGPVAVLAYIVCALVWSTTWYAIRESIAPGGYPTLAAAALRFSVASAVLVPLVVAGWGRPGPRGRRQLLGLAVAGVLNTAGYSLVYAAEETLPGGLVAVLFGTMPFVTGALAALTRTERLTRATVVGALVGLAGVAVISWDRLEVSADQAKGVALVLGAVAAASAYTVLLKRTAGDAHPLATAAVFLPTTAVCLWLLAAAVERRPLPWPPPLRPTAFTVYLAIVGSIVAFASYFYLVRRVRLTTLTTLVFVEPVLALVIDAYLEKRVRLVPRTYLGALLTLSGVVVTAFAGRRGSGRPARPRAGAGGTAAAERRT